MRCVVALASIAVLIGTQTTIAADWRVRPIEGPLPIIFPTARIEADTGRGGVQARALIPLNGKDTEKSVLSNFSLSFIGSDHKITSLGVTQQGRRAELILHDRDGNDRFVGRASWHSAAQFVPGEVSTFGGGEMLIRIAQVPPPDSIAVLRGFRFDRKRGTDANIRLLGVQLLDNETIRVSLVDDQGADFRGIERTVGQAFSIAGIPFAAALWSPALVGAEAARRLDGSEFGRDGLRNYAVTVQYTWVPRSMVAEAMGSVSGTSPVISAGAAPAPNAKVALRGFRFFFGNSDHHLKSISVRLPNDPNAPAISFQDGDGNDPIAWAVDYLTLK